MQLDYLQVRYVCFIVNLFGFQKRRFVKFVR